MFANGRRSAAPSPETLTPRRYPQPRADNLTADYFWVFPNWMLNCYPDNISLNIILPLGPERTLAIFEWYLPEKDLGNEAASKALAFSDEIQVEDVEHMRDRAEKSPLAQLPQRPLQREAGKRRLRFSPDVPRGHAWHDRQLIFVVLLRSADKHL